MYKVLCAHLAGRAGGRAPGAGGRRGCRNRRAGEGCCDEGGGESSSFMCDDSKTRVYINDKNPNKIAIACYGMTRAGGRAPGCTM